MLSCFCFIFHRIIPTFYARLLYNQQCFGSGSVSGSVDMDPGSAKGLLRQKVYIFNFFVTFRPVSEYIINIVYKL